MPDFRPVRHGRRQPAAGRPAAPQPARHDPAPPREGSTARGYDATHQRWRLMVLARDPMCRMCGEAPATEADHIDGNNQNRSLENGQGLCAPCHGRKTRAQTGAAAPTSMPRWLSPAVVPLTIVCGPPAAGKTTYVRERAERKDWIIDLDDLRDRTAENRTALAEALRKRNAMLGCLSQPGRVKGAAWFIVCAPTVSERRRWREMLKPESVIVIATPPEICVARAGDDARRARAALEWWDRYSSDIEDVVVR